MFILRWSVTEDSINRLIIIVITGSAEPQAVAIAAVVEVDVLVEVAVESFVLILEGFFSPFYGNSANTQHLFSP